MNSFSTRLPDKVSEELVRVLGDATTYGFKDLFLAVFKNLKERKAAGGGEEMLRLRTYEKLQTLVKLGVVKKTGKEYQGIKVALARFVENAELAKAKVTADIAARDLLLAAA